MLVLLWVLLLFVGYQGIEGKELSLHLHSGAEQSSNGSTPTATPTVTPTATPTAAPTTGAPATAPTTTTPSSPVASPSSSPTFQESRLFPSILCWTKAAAGWNLFFSYQSLYPAPYTVPISADNFVSNPLSRNVVEYPGMPTVFKPGRHLAFKLNTEDAGPGTTGLIWRLDGIDVQMSWASSFWAQSECPKKVSFKTYISLSCPSSFSSSSLSTTLTNNLISLVNKSKAALPFSQPSGEIIMVNVTLPSSCKSGDTSYVTVLGSLDTASAVVSVPGSGATAMDLIFPLLVTESILSIFDGTSASVIFKDLADPVPLDLSPAVIAKAIPSPPIPSAADVSAFSKYYSAYTLGLTVASIILACLMIAIITSVLCWARRKSKSAEKF